MEKDFYLKRIAHEVVNILGGITETSWEMVERGQLTQVTEKTLSILGMLEILEQKVFFKINYEKFGRIGIGWGDPSEDISEWYSACSDKYAIMNSMFDSALLEDAVRRKFHTNLPQNEKEQPEQDISVSHAYSSYRLSTSEKGLYHLAVIMESLNHDTDEFFLMLIKDWLTIEKEMPIINADFVPAENNLELYSYNHSTESEFNKNEVIRYQTDFDAIVLQYAEEELHNSFGHEDPLLSRIFEQDNDISQLLGKYNRFLGVTITGLVQGRGQSAANPDFPLVPTNGHIEHTIEKSDNQGEGRNGQTTEKPDAQNDVEEAVDGIDGKPIAVRERDKWIYEQAMTYIPYSDIANNLQDVFPKERKIKPERCGQIAREYAKEHDKPKPATRKRTK